MMTKRTTRREFNRSALLATAASFAGLGGCTLTGEVCEAPTVNGVNWIPDVMRPVSWGIDYLGPATGAPRRMLITYPSAARIEDMTRVASLQISPAAAPTAPQNLSLGVDVPDERPILRHCLTRWPVILLMHGGDNVLPLEGRHLYWRTMASALACCGFVVVVPNWDAGQLLYDNQVEMAAMRAWEDVDWVRTQWRHAWWVDPRPEETLFIGHSLGAQVALTLAVNRECAGVVSLGGWRLANGGLPWLERVWKELRVPSLFMRTRYDDLERIPDARWLALTGDKYELTYAGDHFDYLDRLPLVTREPYLPAAPYDRPRLCSGLTEFAAGLVALFAARYLRTETLPPPSLEPPAVNLTPAQLRYPPSLAMTTIGLDTTPGCIDVRMRWVVDGDAGERTLA